MKAVLATDVTVSLTRHGNGPEPGEFADNCMATAKIWVDEAVLAGVSARIAGIPMDSITDGPDSILLAEVSDGNDTLVLSLTNPHFRSGPIQVIAACQLRGKEATYFSLDGH